MLLFRVAGKTSVVSVLTVWLFRKLLKSFYSLDYFSFVSFFNVSCSVPDLDLAIAVSKSFLYCSSCLCLFGDPLAKKLLKFFQRGPRSLSVES